MPLSHGGSAFEVRNHAAKAYLLMLSYSMKNSYWEGMKIVMLQKHDIYLHADVKYEEITVPKVAKTCPFI